MKPDPNNRLTPLESRAALSLASIFGLRMMGLFLILPVFALYAEDLEGVTPLLVGIAISIYGLTQALLQIPFGMLSDRIGRKPVIVMGLLIFALGSVVAAMATTIEWVIIGRALQGSGAVAAAIMALAADLTREQSRTRIMAVIGMSIGFAFTLSLILGPLLNAAIGVPGIFWLTAVLALVGIAVTLLLVPDPVASSFHRDAEPERKSLLAALKNPDLLRLDFGILILHLVLTALFVVLPLVLRDQAGVAADHHWLIYLPVMVLAMALMIPFIVISEKRRKMKPVMVFAVALLCSSQLAFYLFGDSLAGAVIALLLFFTAFNVAEASLPSLISKSAPAAGKGSAMGIYATSQFGGAFLGGLAGGAMHQFYGIESVFLLTAAALALWLVVISGMNPPRHLRNHIVPLGSMDEAQASELRGMLLQLTGVIEAEVIAADGTAYLKIDPDLIAEQGVDEFLRKWM